MRKIIILILFIFIITPVYAEKKLDIYSNSNPEAVKILFEYQLKDQEINSQKAQEVFNYDISQTKAVFYDLNADGVSEIVGYIYASYFYCVQGYELFILKKEKNGYKRISYVHFFPEGELSILDSKTNGFFDLKVHHTRIKKNPDPKYFISLSEAFSFVKYDKTEQCYMYFFLD